MDGLKIRLQIFRHQLYNALHPSRVITLRSFTRNTRYTTEERLAEAMFQVIADYVETDLARDWAQDASHVPTWHKILLEWAPYSMRATIGRQYGMEYLQWLALKTMRETAPTADHWAILLRDIYLWYKDEYPLLCTSSYALYPDPPFMFITADGTPTNEFATNNVINRYHPEYETLTKHIDQREAARKQLIDEKLHTLLTVREHLWV